MYGGHGQVLHLRSTALGAMRRDLITALGTERAKSFLLRYGWSMGQEDAAACRDKAELSDRDWLEAGPQLHGEARMARVRTHLVKMDRERREFRMEGSWEESYEAQEHLRHFGLATEPVCWTLMGYASGYASAVFGERIIFREVACVARGDEVCRFVGLPESEWGLRASQEVPLYEVDVLAEELEVAHQRIRRQNDQLQHVVAIHDQLTQLLLQGADLKGIVETLGRLLGCSVAVEDQRLRTLARFAPGKDRTAEDGSVPTLAELLRRKPELRKQLVRLNQEKRALLFPVGQAPVGQAPVGQAPVGQAPVGQASSGNSPPGPGEPWGDQMVAPILLGEDLLGFITISMVEGLSLELTRMIAERAATTCGLELLKERTTLEVEQRLRGDFLDHLLSPTADPAFLERWAHHLGLGLGETPHRFFLVQTEQREAGEQEWPPSDPDRLYLRLHEVLDRCNLQGIEVHRTGLMVALLPCTAEQVVGVAAALRARVSEERLPVWVGISRPFQGAAPALAAYEECRSIVEAMREGEVDSRVVQVDGLGALQLLFYHGGAAEMSKYARERLAPLLEYDAVHQSGLLPTLRLYLESAGNLQATAEGLNISVSGLKYRLQRIREVGGLDLNDSEERFDLMVALRLLLLTRHRR